jgi:hypothetical protein
MSDFCARGEGVRLSVDAMVESVFNGAKTTKLEPDAAEAEYLRQKLSALRAQCQADLARRYIELQEANNAGWTSRATFVRRIIRALESEVVTMEGLGWSLKDWPDT